MQRRMSRPLIHAANFAAMSPLLAYLTKNCCGHGELGVCITPVSKPKNSM